MTFAKSILTASFCILAGMAQAQTFAYSPVGGDKTSLDVYTFEGAHNAPVMVYVHGGAWTVGDKSRVHDKDDFFLGRGYVFISVNYSLVPQTTVEGQLAELDAALGYIVENVARAGGDPENISLMGHSAGAHLVAMTALNPLEHTRALLAQSGLRAVFTNDTRSYDVVSLAAETGGRLPRAFSRPFGDDPARWAALSPQRHVDAGDAGGPAFLVAHSGQGNVDRRARFSNAFASTLSAAGIQVMLYDGRHLNHEQINKGIGREAGITSAIVRFLETVE